MALGQPADLEQGILLLQLAQLFQQLSWRDPLAGNGLGEEQGLQALGLQGRRLGRDHRPRAGGAPHQHRVGAGVGFLHPQGAVSLARRTRWA